jgi:hypothetical protein
MPARKSSTTASRKPVATPPVASRKPVATPPVATPPPVVDPPPPIPGEEASEEPKKPKGRAGRKKALLALTPTPAPVAGDAPVPTIAKTKKARKAPKKPRAPSAYSLFVKECRETDAVQLGEGGLGAFSKACSEAWRNLADKSKYVAAAAERKLAIQAAAPPKRPPSAYIRFSVQERAKRKLADPALTFKELSQQCAAAWKELSDTEKAAWKPPVVAAGEGAAA